MQKAIIIQDSGMSSLKLDEYDLNYHLSNGWRFVSAAPFGCSVSVTESDVGTHVAAILVIIEKIE